METMYRKSIWSWAILCLLILAIICITVYYFFFAKNGPNFNLRSLQNQNQNQVQNSNTVNVTITNTGFSPANITIHKGTTVIWTNKDTTTHTVTADKDGPMSPDLGTNSSYSDTFAEAGSHPYHCSKHPEMKGSITVIE